MPRLPATVLTVFALACSGDPRPGLPLAADSLPLTTADHAAVSAIVGAWFPPSADGRFLDANCGDVQPEARAVDLDGDGRPEVAVSYGNACLSGLAGRSLTLFIRDAGGNWQAQLGFPAAGFVVADGSSQGYPDLLVTGPGFCFPRWRWDGTAYRHACNEPQAEGGCVSRGNACPAQPGNP